MQYVTKYMIVSQTSGAKKGRKLMPSITLSLKHEISPHIFLILLEMTNFIDHDLPFPTQFGYMSQTYFLYIEASVQ